MVKSGKLPPLPSGISPALKLAIKAMLNLNVRCMPSSADASLCADHQRVTCSRWMR